MTLEPAGAYHLLGLTSNATLDDVKAAYRDLVQVWHPDRFPDNERLREKAARNLQRINEAYAVLRDHRPPGPTVPAPQPEAKSDRRQPAPASSGLADLHYERRVASRPGALRRSVEVLWPSSTYGRRRRSRGWRRSWTVVAIFVLLVAAAAIWFERRLVF